MWASIPIIPKLLIIYIKEFLPTAIKIRREFTSDPWDKKPLMNPKDLYAPKAGIWKSVTQSL